MRTLLKSRPKRGSMNERVAGSNARAGEFNTLLTTGGAVVAAGALPAADRCTVWTFFCSSFIRCSRSRFSQASHSPLLLPGPHAHFLCRSTECADETSGLAAVRSGFACGATLVGVLICSRSFLCATVPVRVPRQPFASFLPRQCECPSVSSVQSSGLEARRPEGRHSPKATRVPAASHPQ